MSIPLDRYYHYLENLCSDDTIIYHWYPHGSKKLENLRMFRDYNNKEYSTLNLSLTMVCHDQEPLSFDYYTDDDISNLHNITFANRPLGKVNFFQNIIKSMPAIRCATLNPFTVYDKLLLCHSEKNSAELLKFEASGFIGVYIWFHAIVARDWFRYAEHDPALAHSVDYKYDFLIYNRAWTNTREYRLKFCEMLVESELTSSCKTSFAAVDTGVNYVDHVFLNKDFVLNNYNLEGHFVENTTTSCYSADYDNTDYNECGIEVVLETLFDDQRNHLTEKSLRPIACNKPFILVSTPFSLQYLRSYGFKTFNGLIDETYDTILDSRERLDAIVKELKRISCLPQSDKQELWEKLNAVAAYNQQLFFSEQWHDSILNEFKTNLAQAKALAEDHQTGKYLRELYTQLDINQVQSVRPESRKILDDWLMSNGHTY
jgi:hypothetical protein